MEKNGKGVPQNGWNEYSKLVLNELERLNENDEKNSINTYRDKSKINQNR